VQPHHLEVLDGIVDEGCLARAAAELNRMNSFKVGGAGSEGRTCVCVETRSGVRCVKMRPTYDGPLQGAAEYSCKKAQRTALLTMTGLLAMEVLFVNNPTTFVAGQYCMQWLAVQLVRVCP
jgi:hypothetical protein